MSHQERIAYLVEQIKLEHSRVQKDHVLEWIGTDDARLKAFMEVYFNGDPIVGQRGAYVLGWLDKRHQHILAPHYPRMIAEMDQKMHPARTRNLLRLFETVDIPPAIQMELMDKCFEFIQNPQQPGAIRAFAITVLSRLVEPYPELQAEACLVLQEHLPEAPAAFRVRTRDFLKKFRKAL